MANKVQYKRMFCTIQCICYRLALMKTRPLFVNCWLWASTMTTTTFKYICDEPKLSCR